MRKFLILAILSLVQFFNAKGIDPQFSQFYTSPIYLGPSFAGSTGMSRAVINYRDQWPNLPGHFTTYAVSLDTYVPKYNTGLAFLIMRDQAGNGKLSATNVGISYSYKAKLGHKLYFQPGISSYYVMYNINPNGITYADQYIGNQIFPISVEEDVENYQHIDFATSVLLYNDNMWFGSTIDHLMKLGPSLATNYRYASVKYSVYGGSKIALSHRMKRKLESSLTLTFNYKSQDNVKQFDFGAYAYKFPLYIGLWYRGLPVLSKNSQDALCFLLGYKNDNFSIGYNYDFTISNLMGRTGGAHEISMSYNFGSALSIKKKRGAVPCPTF
jgi:type IX secretion system PorP/SprF family membrane protein